MSRTAASRRRERAKVLGENASDFRALRAVLVAQFDFDLVEYSAGPTFAGTVRALRSEFGRGPTWFQLGERLRLHHPHLLPPAPPSASSRFRYLWWQQTMTATLPLLRAAGWVIYTDTPRSLDVGPRATLPSLEKAPTAC